MLSIDVTSRDGELRVTDDVASSSLARGTSLILHFSTTYIQFKRRKEYMKRTKYQEHLRSSNAVYIFKTSLERTYDIGKVKRIVKNLDSKLDAFSL